jgi:hypothetical protein
VHAYPRIERQTVLAAPSGVPLDRHEGIALLQARPHRRDQCFETVPARDRDHGAKRLRAPPFPAPRPRNRDQHRAQDVRALLLEAALDGAVDSRRQILDRALPADRDRARPRDDLVPLEQVELEVRALFGQAAPVAVQDVAVVVVLGELVARRVPGGLDEIRPLPDG